MINRKRTWKDCEDQKILAVYNEVMAEAKKLYPEYFEKTTYKFYIDSSTRHLGRCMWQYDKSTLCSERGFKNHCGNIRCSEVVILLSKYLKDIKQITSVLVHEAGHAVTPGDHHSSLWFVRSNKIGEKFKVSINGRLANEEEMLDFTKNIRKENGYKEQNKYTVKCKCCGREIHKKRMCSIIKEPKKWRCGVCNGSFERIK